MNTYDDWKLAAPEAAPEAPHAEVIDTICELVEAAALEMGFDNMQVAYVWDMLHELMERYDRDNAERL